MAYAQASDGDLAPSNLSASIVDGFVTLSWVAPAEDADSVTGYEILRRRPLQGERSLSVLVPDTQSAGTTYVDLTANEPEERYVYRVAALRGSEKSERSNAARITLPEDYEQPEVGDESSCQVEVREAVVWSATMSVVDYGTGTIGADSPDLFSNQGGSAGLKAKSLWYHTGDRKLRLEFTEGVADAEEMALEFDDVSLAFPEWSSNESSFRWSDVGVDWTGSQTVEVRVVWAVSGSPATGAPTISGAAQAGQTLTADPSGIADDDGITNPTFCYQWVSNDGNADADIPDATASTYEVSDDDVGKTIKVRVTFTDDAGNGESLTSEPTDEVTFSPEALAPSGLTAEAGDDGVSLSWDAPAKDLDSITEYELIRSAVQSGSQPSFEHFVTGSTDTRWVDSNANIPGLVLYSYMVRALRDGEPSEWSNLVDIGVDTPQPESLAPTNLTAEVGDDGVSLTWIAPEEDAGSVTGYEVLRGQGEAELTTLAAVADTAYTDDTATEPGETYAYRVRALRGEEKSQPSNRAAAVISKITRADGDPPVAARQSDPPARAIWSAIMTVGTSTDGQEFGYSRKDRDFKNDALSVTTFEYYSTTYTVESIKQGILGDSTRESASPGGIFGTFLLFVVSPIPPDTAESEWILDVDGAEFSDEDDGLVDHDQTLNKTFFAWDIHAISFEGGAMVPLSLKVLNWPATGHPAITGTPVPGETLTADVSGITDPDGPTNPTYTYEWLDSGLIPIGTGPTYTVSEDDLGTVITLRVSFEDDAGYKEVLTSDELWVHTRLDLHSDNDSARDIWGNATTIWVSDGTDDKIYAYHRLDASRDSSQDFNSLSEAGNNSPRGIWSDGTTMYVADWSDDKVYAYKMSDKSHDSAKDFTFDSDNTIPTGIWGNADTIWVANDGSGAGNKLFAYKRLDGTHDADKDFDALNGAGNVHPRGIWSDGATMYVSDRSDDKVYAYKMSDQSWDLARDIYLDSDNGGASGIWSYAANKFYVADFSEEKLFVYARNTVFWSATMTVGADPNDASLLGWHSSAGDFRGDALDNTTFEIGSTTYTVRSIQLDVSTLDFDIEPQASEHDVSDLVLLIDGAEFALTDLDNSNTGSTVFSWQPPGLSWTASTWVILQIVEKNLPATGDVTVTGASQEGEALSADVSAISDGNGLADAQFNYQWLKDGNPIPGAQAPDYWPHGEDAGGRFSVRVSFLDDANYEEGPFTSAETAPVQDSDTVEVVWSATMTVGEASGTFGYDIDENPVQGSLSPTSFDYAGNTYEVEYLYHDLPVINLVISPSLPGVLSPWFTGRTIGLTADWVRLANTIGRLLTPTGP